MRPVPLILGLVLITGLIIHDVYEFFVTNEGIRYFSSEPQRLLNVTLLGVVGGRGAGLAGAGVRGRRLRAVEADGTGRPGLGAAVEGDLSVNLPGVRAAPGRVDAADGGPDR